MENNARLIKPVTTRTPRLTGSAKECIEEIMRIEKQDPGTLFVFECLSPQLSRYYDERLWNKPVNARADSTEEIKGVRAWRQKRGMTQHQLAVASHVSRVTIAYIETGVHKPSTDTLRKLAKPLGCLIDDLVE
jgi:DNA-binding XRE family transcriptional regulator